MKSFHKSMRRNETYQKVTAYLVAQGYSFEPIQGGKHPYLEVDLKQGSKVKYFFPSSAGDRRSAENAVGQIKRLIRQRLGGRNYHGS
jgi:hypothetical protein